MSKSLNNSKSDPIEAILDDINPIEQKRIQLRMKLAAKIDEARMDQNLSKGQFAKKMNKSPSEITKWLSGTHNFTINSLIDIENALNIEILNFEIKEQVFKTHVVVVSETSIKQWDIAEIEETKMLSEFKTGASYGELIQCENATTEA